MIIVAYGSVILRISYRLSLSAKFLLIVLFNFPFYTRVLIIILPIPLFRLCVLIIGLCEVFWWSCCLLQVISELEPIKWYQSGRFSDMLTPAPNTRLSEAERKILDAVDKRVDEAVEKLAERQGAMENQLAEVMRAIKAMLPPVLPPPKDEEGSSSGVVIGVQKENEQLEDWSKPTRYEFPKFEGVGF